MEQLKTNNLVPQPVFFLTGDAEIDSVCPTHPQILQEVTMIEMDDGRLMLLGGLSAPIFPRRVGTVDVAAFFQQIDGSRSIEHLCADHLPGAQERRRLVFMLLRNGLLEQPTDGDHDHAKLNRNTLAYLAKVMDQTRVYNRRSDIAAALEHPIMIAGEKSFCDDLRSALTDIGLRSSAYEADADTAAKFAIVVLTNDSAQDALVLQLQRRGVPVLLVSPRANALDIGPLLINRGTCTVACYRADTLDRAYATDPRYRALWLATACNMILLLHSATAPVSLINNFIRYEVAAGGIKSSRIAVVRRFALGADIMPMHTLQDPELLKRLERYSKIALPPRRIIGVKGHDAHYAPKNIAAAKELPLAHANPDRALTPDNADRVQLRLFKLIKRSFGYMENKDGYLKRICPSGGNLGAAECLVIWRNTARKTMNVLRYIPEMHILEPLVQGALNVSLQNLPEYEIVCLANSEKTRRKYAEFGSNLAFLDSGIAAAFLSVTAKAEGQALTISYTPSEDSTVRQVIESRSNSYEFVWRAELLPSDPVSEDADSRMNTLDRILDQRRAVRDCVGLDLSLDVLEGVLRCSMPLTRDQRSADLLAGLVPILHVKLNGVYATYVFDCEHGLRILADSTLTHDQPGQELLSQRNLSEAPGKLFILTELPKVLELFGTGGHDQVLTLTGQWIGAFWLEIERRQHCGCPAGATIESDLLSNLPVEYGALFNLFSFTFGRLAAQ